MLGVRVGKITWWKNGWNGQYRKFWHTINWMLISWGEMIPINWNNPSIENWVPLGSLGFPWVPFTPPTSKLHRFRQDELLCTYAALILHDDGAAPLSTMINIESFFFVMMMMMMMMINYYYYCCPSYYHCHCSYCSLMMFIISIIVVLVHLETLSQHFLTCFFWQIDCNRGTSGTAENRRTSY